MEWGLGRLADILGSPWAKWLKMADRYHLGGRRPPYIKLKLIVCRFKKYMMEML